MKIVLFLVGPTACGKTDIAFHLAKKLNAEIISCDSMQIYKGMDILTSKPHPRLLKKIKHHLISIKSPIYEFNVAEYRKMALRKIKLLLNKNRIPLFVGGSGFYMSVVLDGIFPEDPGDRKIREKLYIQAKEQGSIKLYERLKGIDHKAAAKIHPHDLRRIIRALEVYEKTGSPISELQKQRKGIWSDYKVRVFGIRRSKEDLYNRIDKRVDDMFKLKVIDEVKKLSRLTLSRTASYAIGIREIRGYLAGNYGLDEAKRQMKHNTRLYAKRQMTWFKKDKRIKWIKAGKKDSPKEIADKILCQLKKRS